MYIRRNIVATSRTVSDIVTRHCFTLMLPVIDIWSIYMDEKDPLLIHELVFTLDVDSIVNTVIVFQLFVSNSPHLSLVLA